VVREAKLYLNQPATSTEPTDVPFPNLFLDDVVVRVTDGHNLVGNPNFESGLPDSWGLNAPATQTVDSTAAHGGTRSLHLTMRTLPTSGPRYILPTGAARYRFSFWVRHAGAQTHDLTLQPMYTCIGGTAMTPAPIAMAAAVPGDTWVELTGIATLPPAEGGDPTPERVTLECIPRSGVLLQLFDFIGGHGQRATQLGPALAERQPLGQLKPRDDGRVFQETAVVRNEVGHAETVHTALDVARQRLPVVHEVREFRTERLFVDQQTLLALLHVLLGLLRLCRVLSDLLGDV
jgi:hypothetical protein